MNGSKNILEMRKIVNSGKVNNSKYHFCHVISRNGKFLKNPMTYIYRMYIVLHVMSLVFELRDNNNNNNLQHAFFLDFNFNFTSSREK